jgi:hypothetical protein
MMMGCIASLGEQESGRGWREEGRVGVSDGWSGEVLEASWHLEI